MSQAPDSNRFEAHLDYLKLPYIRNHYRDAIQQAAEHDTDLLGCLMQLIDAEAQLRHDRSVERRLRLARFPVRKNLEQFDWTWPRKINRLQVQNLFRLQFIEQCANVIIVGGVGLGKTHLATALGIAACQQSYSVLFTSAIDAVNYKKARAFARFTLTASQAAGRLKKDLGKFLRPRVLLLDELGYLPIDKTGAELLFQIISQRYENGSTIITTNRVFKKWPEIFNNDSTLTSAVLDRLLHHAETVKIEGRSFRMKDKIDSN